MRNKQFNNNLFLMSFLFLGLLFLGMRPKAEDDKNGSKQLSALEKTTIANAVLLVYTAPIFSVILAAIFLREKISF